MEHDEEFLRLMSNLMGRMNVPRPIGAAAIILLERVKHLCPDCQGTNERRESNPEGCLHQSAPRIIDLLLEAVDGRAHG